MSDGPRIIVAEPVELVDAPRRSHRTRFVKHDDDPLGIAPAQRSEIVTMLLAMGRDWCTAAVTA